MLFAALASHPEAWQRRSGLPRVRAACFCSDCNPPWNGSAMLPEPLVLGPFLDGPVAHRPVAEPPALQPLIGHSVIARRIHIGSNLLVALLLAMQAISGTRNLLLSGSDADTLTPKGLTQKCSVYPPERQRG